MRTITIKCDVCKGTHKNMADARICFEQNKDKVMSKTNVKVKAKVQPKVKAAAVKTFLTKVEAEEFVQNNPGTRLIQTVKVKRVNVFNKETEKYETKEEKTYTVIL